MVKKIKNKNNKGKVLLVDVETCDNSRVILDFSFMVVDLESATYSHLSTYIIKETWNNKELLKGEYIDKDKIIEYKEGIDKGLYKLISFYEFVKELEKILTLYNISVFSAYNVKFDYDALIKTFNYYNVIIPKSIQSLDLFDLYEYSKTLFLNKKYYNFCLDNNYFTPKGYIKTNVETLYKFILKDNNFIEKHLGMDDLKKEFHILQLAMLSSYKNGKKTYKVNKFYDWRETKSFQQSISINNQ